VYLTRDTRRSRRMGRRGGLSAGIEDQLNFYRIGKLFHATRGRQ